MNGNKMSIRMDKEPGGCVSDSSKRFFECVDEKTTCGDKNEYRLVNCGAGSQKGANDGGAPGEPSGGCAGEGYVTVEM